MIALRVGGRYLTRDDRPVAIVYMSRDVAHSEPFIGVFTDTDEVGTWTAGGVWNSADEDESAHDLVDVDYSAEPAPHPLYR